MEGRKDGREGEGSRRGEGTGREGSSARTSERSPSSKLATTPLHTELGLVILVLSKHYRAPLVANVSRFQNGFCTVCWNVYQSITAAKPMTVLYPLCEV